MVRKMMVRMVEMVEIVVIIIKGDNPSVSFEE